MVLNLEHKLPLSSKKRKIGAFIQRLTVGVPDVSLPIRSLCIATILVAAMGVAALQPSVYSVNNPLETATVTVTETSAVATTETSTTSILVTSVITVTSSTTESTTATTTSILTSVIYVPTLVGVTVTTTLSTYTLTETMALTHTTTESMTTTATTTETAPFWNTASSDPEGLWVLFLGVLLGIAAVAVHRKYAWAGPLAVTTLYVAICVGVFQVRENRIQYMLGYFFVLIGAVIERLARGKEKSNGLRSDTVANVSGTL